MLRASSKQAIFTLLDDTYFGASNFTVQYGNGDPQWIRVTFIPNANFAFAVEQEPFMSKPYRTSEAPGIKFLKPDQHRAFDFDECIRRIPAWVNRIKEEVIDSNPINRELQAVRRQLEERIDLLAERQEEFFTRDEAEQLAQRLAEFSAKLDQVSAANGDLSSVVESLKAKMEELTAATLQVNKGTWLRMAGSRLLNTTKAILVSKEGREFALEAAKRVLLEGPK